MLLGLLQNEIAKVDGEPPTPDRDPPDLVHGQVRWQGQLHILAEKLPQDGRIWIGVVIKSAPKWNWDDVANLVRFVAGCADPEEGVGAATVILEVLDEERI